MYQTFGEYCAWGRKEEGKKKWIILGKSCLYNSIDSIVISPTLWSPCSVLVTASVKAMEDTDIHSHLQNKNYLFVQDETLVISGISHFHLHLVRTVVLWSGPTFPLSHKIVNIAGRMSALSFCFFSRTRITLISMNVSVSFWLQCYQLLSITVPCLLLVDSSFFY